MNRINNKREQSILGEEGKTREDVEIIISFTTPIIVPAGHYFFRPEVLVTGGDFLYLSAPDRAPLRGGLASLDPQLKAGAGLVANRHGHHRRHHTAHIQYDVFPGR